MPRHMGPPGPKMGGGGGGGGGGTHMPVTPVHFSQPKLYRPVQFWLRKLYRAVQFSPGTIFCVNVLSPNK